MWKICSSNWESSPNRGENKEYLKPPPRSDWIRTTCHQNHRFPPHLRVCVFVNSPPLPISHPHLPTSRFAASALAANILQEVDSKSSICPLSYLRFSKSFEERLGSWKLESHLHQIFLKKNPVNVSFLKLGKFWNMSLRCQASDFVLSEERGVFVSNWLRGGKVVKKFFPKVLENPTSTEEQRKQQKKRHDNDNCISHQGKDGTVTIYWSKIYISPVTTSLVFFWGGDCAIHVDHRLGVWHLQLDFCLVV